MTRPNCLPIALLAAVLLYLPSISNAQGIVVPGVGPVNRSMAGTAMAAPLDAAGAIHWNPASLTGLEQSEFMVGVELLQLDTHLTSSVAGTPLSGSTRSDSGLNVLPTVAVAFQPRDSRWTYGMGLFAVGGFSFNYPGDVNNPILNNNSIYSKLSVLQLVPTAAYQVTDRLSLGFAPTISMIEATLDPDFLHSPSLSGYPAATHTRTHWGVGFQAGLYYEMDNCWRLGASYKSPQWSEELTFYDSNPATGPQTLRMNVDYPAIISAGASYYGIPGVVWAIDFRYVDYANTTPFGDDTGFDGTLAATGLGWRSVFSVSTGLQYQLTEALSLRMGYIYTQNPIADADSFYNIQAPAIYEHMVSIGATLRISCRTSLSVAYLRAFENSIEGFAPPETGLPAGTVSVGSTLAINALVAGLQVRF